MEIVYLGSRPICKQNECAFALEGDRTVDETHVKIVLQAKKTLQAVQVTDLRSSTGTLFNGKPIAAGKDRKAFINDTICIGDSTIKILPLAEEETKAMVDREIRAGKERRMERKRLKMIHITPETEDDLLESIWANTMEKKLKASTKSRRPSGVPRTTPRSSASVTGRSPDNRGFIRHFKANPNLVSSREPPVRHSSQARENDERSMCSQSTTSRSTISRPVPSQLTTYSPKELIDIRAARITAQQIARRWLAQKKVAVLRRELAALDIQRCFDRNTGFRQSTNN
jgi:hypothetical protein